MISIPPRLQGVLDELIPKNEQQAFVELAVTDALEKHKKIRKPTDAVEVFVDGGSRGNPGPSGGGFACYKNGKITLKGSEFFGTQTNNRAEYLALRLALRNIYEALPMAHVQCFMDSQLVAEQMSGNYRVKSENVKPLYEEVRRIADQFPSFKIDYIPREQNKVADKLANEAMDRGQ